MNDFYNITPLCLGTITRQRSNMMLGESDEEMDFPLLSFYLENKDHKILIDLGGSRPDGIHWMPYSQKKEETLEYHLAELGVSASDIDAILFTHLHWDHAGHISLFPHASFYAQKAECDVVTCGTEPGYEYPLVQGIKYISIDGDEKNILPGISALLTPGHSYGSQCFLVETSSGTKAICGDLFPTYENVEKMIPNGRLYDEAIIRSSMKKIADINAEIIPGHDFKVLEQ